MMRDPGARRSGPSRRNGRAAVVLALGATLVAVALGVVWRWRAVPSRPVPSNPDPRLTFATPYRNVRPDVKYVGDAECAACHPTQAETYREHPMGRSFATVAERAGKDEYGAAVNNPFERLGVRFEVERRGDRVFHRQSGLDRDGRALVAATEEMRYVIGSGTRGRSYFFTRDGYLFFSPISWYSQAHRWDQSPGNLEVYLPGRPVRPECVFCHANHADPVPDAINRYREPIFQGYSIGCERCHGPGELHVQRRANGEVVAGLDDTIVNPARLEPELRESVCQQCHFQGLNRFPRRGRQVFDFRPGLPVQEFWAFIVRAAPNGQQQRAVSHVEQMYASRCFQASAGRMGCITCHDPHAVPKQTVAHYRDRCLRCHGPAASAGGCSLSEFTRRERQPDDSCFACHMPRAPSADIIHTAVTDHRILRAPGETRPVPGLMPGAIPLKPFATDRDPRDPQVSRDLAVALIRLARDEEALRTGFGHLALPLAEAAVHADPTDVAALSAYGYALWTKGRATEARAAFEAARAPDAEEIVKDLAQVNEGLGDVTAALDYWRRAVELNPWHCGYRFPFAELLFKQGRYDEALEHCRALLRFNPTEPRTRTLLVKCYQAKGDRERARKEFDLLVQLDPASRAELEPWFDRPRP
jgi:tetratricopeptide (TPR) repeat protein